jgi:glycosyltransferase involved in cell wall biosynthesis
LKLCIFTNHFFPEDFKVNDIAFELAKRGNEITVITAIPDYPQGKFYNGYSLFKRKREKVNGVLVYRLPIIPRGKGRRIEIIINYVSYFLSTLFFTFFSLYEKEYDVVFVHLTSPFFIGLPAVFLKRKQYIPLVFWVLDLWPESLSAAGGITNKFFLDTQKKMVQYVYNNCDRILISSQGYKKSICEKGNYTDKLVYFPNWAEDVSKNSAIVDLDMIFPFSKFTNDDFILLFAGNMGEAQNLDSVMEAAKLTLENSKIKWVFIGDGRRRKQLIKKIKSYNLSDSVFFPGRYPLDSMPIFIQRADVLLVSLKDERIFNLTVPAKLQFYMSQSKPVLAMLNGDGAELINEAQCGIAVPSNDTLALQTAVERLFSMAKDELKDMGNNGKKYYEEHFQKKDRIDQLEAIINKNLT